MNQIIDYCTRLLSKVKKHHVYIISNSWAKEKTLRFHLIFFGVFFPTLIVFIYFTFFYSPMYISTSAFALRSNDTTALPDFAGVFFKNTSSTSLDAHIVESYIYSLNMMDKVDKKIDIKAHFGSKERDIFSRIARNATREEMLKYWQWIVSVSNKVDKGIIYLETKAYTPEVAQEINKALLELSEELVNTINARSHQDSLKLARDEVDAAEKRVISAQEALRVFRDNRSMLDPETTAKSIEGVVAQLEAESASIQAELTAALEVMQPSSSRVVTLQTKLSAIKNQLEKEKERLAGLNTDDETLSSLVGQYAKLSTEEKFAQQQLLQSMTSFESARVNALSQSLYIVSFEPPSLPQESLYPRPLLVTFMTFITLLTAIGLISLIIAAIKDHMGV